jgi:hypothetical protein
MPPGFKDAQDNVLCCFYGERSFNSEIWLMLKKNIIIQSMTLCLILFHFLKHECEAQTCYARINQFEETFTGYRVIPDEKIYPADSIYNFKLEQSIYISFCCTPPFSPPLTLHYCRNDKIVNFRIFLSPETFIIKFLHLKHPWHQSSDEKSNSPCSC